MKKNLKPLKNYLDIINEKVLAGWTKSKDPKYYYQDDQGKIHAVTQSWAKNKEYTPLNNKDVFKHIGKVHHSIHKKIESIKDDIHKSCKHLKGSKRERSENLLNLVNNLQKSKSKNQRKSIVRKMVNNRLIMRSISENKIYADPHTGLNYKIFGDESTFSKIVNEIAKESGVDIPVREQSLNNALNYHRGKYSEFYLVSLLSNKETNYKKHKSELSKYGEDVKKIETNVQKISESIKQQFPEIQSIEYVGNQKSHDSTDIIVRHIENGKEIEKKLSLKVYSDSSNIDIKNLGSLSFGSTFIKNDKLDEQIKKIYDQNKSSVSDTEDEYEEKKIKMRSEFINTIGDALTKSSQKDLNHLWNSVLGIKKNENVYTVLGNITNNDVKIINNNEFKQKGKIFVSINKNRITVDLNDESKRKIFIDLNIQRKKAPRLIFKTNLN